MKASVQAQLRRLSLIVVLMMIMTAASAQKWAYVNTEYILENIPDYKAAQQQLDNLSIEWQKEIEDRYSIIDKLYKTYQAEQVLLTEEMKKRRQDEIALKEKDVKELQKQRFNVARTKSHLKKKTLKSCKSNASGMKVIFSKRSRNWSNQFRIRFTTPSRN